MSKLSSLGNAPPVPGTGRQRAQTVSEKPLSAPIDTKRSKTPISQSVADLPLAPLDLGKRSSSRSSAIPDDPLAAVESKRSKTPGVESTKPPKQRTSKSQLAPIDEKPEKPKKVLSTMEIEKLLDMSDITGDDNEDDSSSHTAPAYVPSSMAPTSLAPGTVPTFGRRAGGTMGSSEPSPRVSVTHTPYQSASVTSAADKALAQATAFLLDDDAPIAPVTAPASVTAPSSQPVSQPLSQRSIAGDVSVSAQGLFSVQEWSKWLNVPIGSERGLFAIVEEASLTPLPPSWVFRAGIFVNTRTSNEQKEHPLLPSYTARITKQRMNLELTPTNITTDTYSDEMTESEDIRTPQKPMRVSDPIVTTVLPPTPQLDPTPSESITAKPSVFNPPAPVSKPSIFDPPQPKSQPQTQSLQPSASSYQQPLTSTALPSRSVDPPTQFYSPAVSAVIPPATALSIARNDRYTAPTNVIAQAPSSPLDALHEERFRQQMSAIDTRHQETLHAAQREGQHQIQLERSLLSQTEERYRQQIVTLEKRFQDLLTSSQRDLQQQAERDRQMLEQTEERLRAQLVAAEKRHQEDLLEAQRVAQQQVQLERAQALRAQEVGKLTESVTQSAVAVQDLKSRVESSLDAGLIAREAACREREQRLGAAEERAAAAMRQVEVDRTQLQALVASLQQSMSEQQRHADAAAARATHEQARLQSLVSSADAERHAVLKIAEEERERLDAERAKFQTERDNFFRENSEERRRLAQESAQLSQLKDQLQQREGQIAALLSEQKAAAQAARNEAARQAQLTQEAAEAIERQRRELKQQYMALEAERKAFQEETENFREVGVQMQQRSKEVATIYEAAVEERRIAQQAMDDAASLRRQAVEAEQRAEHARQQHTASQRIHEQERLALVKERRELSALQEQASKSIHEARMLQSQLQMMQTRGSASPMAGHREIHTSPSSSQFAKSSYVRPRSGSGLQPRVPSTPAPRGTFAKPVDVDSVRQQLELWQRERKDSASYLQSQADYLTSLKAPAVSPTHSMNQSFQPLLAMSATTDGRSSAPSTPGTTLMSTFQDASTVTPQRMVQFAPRTPSGHTADNTRDSTFMRVSDTSVSGEKYLSGVSMDVTSLSKEEPAIGSSV